MINTALSSNAGLVLCAISTTECPRNTLDDIEARAFGDGATLSAERTLAGLRELETLGLVIWTRSMIALTAAGRACWEVEAEARYGYLIAGAGGA